MKFEIKDVVDRIAAVFTGGSIRKFSPLVRQVFLASGPLLLTTSLGMTSGYSAILLPQLHFEDSKISEEEASWIASMAALPMAFGCILGGLLMEKYGRKSTHIITSVPCFTGWIIIAFAKNVPTLLIGRFLNGLSGGLLGPCTGVYIGETADPKNRGLLLGAISLAVALGLFLSHLLGTFLSWQMTAIVSSSLPLVSLILLLAVPESPSWLAKQNRLVEAESSFYWCRGYSEETKNEFSITSKRQNESLASNRQIFKNEFLKPLLIIVVFIVANQWAGVNALTFYTVTIMKNLLGSGLDNYLAMLIVDVIRVVMSVIACIVLKKIGRRPLALTSGCGTFISLFTLSAYTFFSKETHHDLVYAIVPMVSLVAYISFITIGFVPLPWAMMGEVFPLSSRNVGAGLSSFMGFAAFFAVVKTSPSMFGQFGTDGTFLVYGVVALLGTVFIFAFLPETKDKPLYEIEDQFKKNENKV